MKLIIISIAIVAASAASAQDHQCSKHDKHAADAASIDQIRMHLQHIARAFASGDFAMPMFIHDRMPPGAREMQKRKADISYRYEETERGGRVVISTAGRRSIQAIHDFLRFQTEEHGERP
jgi:predicted lipid-binding transport protein (Tim44 family)